MTVMLEGPNLTIADVVVVGRGQDRVELADTALERMASARAVVEELAEGEPRYGITTGFGALATVAIPPERRRALQAALVRSHAAGMGPSIDPEVVRAMMLLRARTLALGHSGARPVVAERMLDFVNSGYTPVVYEYGSLGASGDLAPLAHAALSLMGEGEVTRPDGGVALAAEALAAIGVEPLEFVEKEGLAVTNGTDGILAMLCLAVHDTQRLVAQADVAAAMTVEGLLATDRPFAADLQALRPHPGQAISAANLRQLLSGSPIVASHRDGDARVQDAYSVRCTPAVHGAARDTLDHVRAVTERELAAAIDNPMVMPDGRVESCGNFHGAPVGFAADFLAIAVAELGAIAERRMDRLLDRSRNQGLPPFLADEVGVDSGLMIGHYTAASMVGENRRLAAPASVDSFPTSGMQEDHVSMGWSAARKLRTVIANTRRILAIEMVISARAIELRAPLKPAEATGAAVAGIRSTVPGPGPDRYLAPELQAAEALLQTNTLEDALASAGVQLG